MAIREIVLDTETTGLDARVDKVIEIGCIETINHLPTGNHFHVYINPQRIVPEAAFKVHGLSTDFLLSKPLFRHIAHDFLSFIADSPLVIHNAKFDIKFLNAELTRLDLQTIPLERAVDTLQIAKKMFPGSPATLDALCKRFNIDNSNRDLHGALIDAKLLASVYLALIGGRQTSISFQEKEVNSINRQKQFRSPRNFPISDIERLQHREFIASIK